MKIERRETPGHGAVVAEVGSIMHARPICSCIVATLSAVGVLAIHDPARAEERGPEPVRVALPQALGGGSELAGYARSGPSNASRPSGNRSVRRHSESAAKEAIEPLASPPSSVDLSTWATTAGNQDPYDLCEFWSVGYTSLGWWLNRSGLAGNPMNPMFMYSSLVPSCNGGESVDIRNPAEFLQATGNLPLSLFPSTSCVAPTAAETAEAARFKISSYQYSTLIMSSATPQTLIESALAGGTPISFTFEAFQELYNVTSTNYLVGPPASGSTYYGNHAVTALGYTDVGVWFENTWGTTWGKSGWAMLTWDFVNGKTTEYGPNVQDAVILGGIALAPLADAGPADASEAGAGGGDASVDAGPDGALIAHTDAAVFAADASTATDAGRSVPLSDASAPAIDDAGEAAGARPAAAGGGCAVGAQARPWAARELIALVVPLLAAARRRRVARTGA